MYEENFEFHPTGNWNADDASEPAGRINGQMLFESVVCDLHWTVLQIGTLSCLMNACVRTDASWTLRAWRGSLQDNSQVIILGLRFFPDIGVNKDIIDAIEATYQKFSALKTRSSSLFTADSCYNGQQRRELGEQAPEWRSLCQTSIAALRALEPETQQRLQDIYVANSRILVQFLHEASDGTTRLVNQWGEIKLPQLAQRRRTPRKSINQSCRVIINGHSTSATIHDVSVQGIGIRSSTSFDVGQDLQIALQNGRKIKAIVAWRGADRAGLQLYAPLAPSDPLLA